MPDQQEGQGGAEDGKYDGERGETCDVHCPPPSCPGGVTLGEPGCSSAAARSALSLRSATLTVAPVPRAGGVGDPVAVRTDHGEREFRGLHRDHGVVLGVEAGGLGDAAVFGVVLDLILAGQHPGAVDDAEHERGHGKGDHDRGQDQRLRQRIVVVLGVGVLVEQRREPGVAAGGEDQQVGGVRQQHQAQQDPGEAALQDQVDAAGVQGAHDCQQGQVDAHACPSVAGGFGRDRRVPGPRTVRSGMFLEVFIDFGAEAAQHVQHQSDDDDVDADVEHGGGDEFDVAEDRQPEFDDGGLEHLAAEQQGRDAGGCRRGEADAEQGAGADRGGLAELEPAAGEVADGEGQPGGESAGEASAGEVVAGQEEVDREDDQRVEDQPGDNFEDDRAPFRRQGPARHKPRVAAGGGKPAAHGQRGVVPGVAAPAPRIRRPTVPSATRGRTPGCRRRGRGRR